MPKTDKRITVESVEKLAAKLRDLPALDPGKQTVTKQEAVKRLSKEIRELLQRGYTLEQIAEMMSKEGIAIALPSLRSYLQRAAPARKERKKAQPEEKHVTPAPVVAPEQRAGEFTARPDTKDI